jgi:hypothetical protein
MLANYISAKRSYSKYRKNYKTHKAAQFLKGQRKRNRHFPKGAIQKVYEKMVDITNHKGNTNKKHEIPAQIYSGGCYKKRK